MRIQLLLTALVLAATAVQAGLLQSSIHNARQRLDHDEDANTSPSSLYSSQHIQQRVIDHIPKLSQYIQQEFADIERNPDYFSDLTTTVESLLRSHSAETIMQDLKKPEVLAKLAIYSIDHDSAIQFIDHILCKLPSHHHHAKNVDHLCSISDDFTHPEVIDELVTGIEKSWAKGSVINWLKEKRKQYTTIHHANIGLAQLRGGASPATHHLAAPMHQGIHHKVRMRVSQCMQSLARGLRSTADRLVSPNKTKKNRPSR